VPRCAAAARFSVELLRHNWRYAAAVSANAVIGIAMTQLDKVILSGMLPLDLYGYYGIASQLASGIWSIIVPFNTAVFPRFVQLYQGRAESELRALFHRTSQVLAALLFPLCALLVIFSPEILRLWMRDPLVAQNCRWIVSCLVFGTMLNGVASVPGYAASAFGWPGLVTRTNLVQVVLIVPLMVVLVVKWQGLGAAVTWIVLNCTYVLFMVPRFFRRYFREEQWAWYVRDQALPAAVAFAVTLAAAGVLPDALGRPALAAWLGAILALASAATALSLPEVRALVAARLPGIRPARG
jgi:O-antigen/teichoic acid export membrane protein